MKNINTMLLLDGYKLGHRIQYPKGTEKVYSTFTPRGSRIDGVDEIVFFGLQAFIKKYLIDYYNVNFFEEDIDEIVNDYKRFIKYYLGDDDADVEHIRNLHKLGYLPIEIRAIKEGLKVQMRVPMFTIESTHPEFSWITNYLETLVSSEMWYPIVSANTSLMYRDIADRFAKETIGDTGFSKFQCHDFSQRGQHCTESAILSGMAHMLSFVGTDVVPAVVNIEKYYNGNMEKEMIGVSVNATEHAVMCAGEKDSEYETYKRLLTETYPKGIISIVSDTWDYWNVLTDILVKLKPIIMERNGVTTLRPDSGNPFKIICGDPESNLEHVRKGSIEVLWDLFGGSINNLGYKVLDSHIGLIYGEAIQPQLMESILKRLKEKGFASTNILFGVGSYGFLSGGVGGGIATRDTFGIACKATYVVVNGEERKIFKDPKTDDGLKKSQKGMVVVALNENDKMIAIDDNTSSERDYLSSVDLLEVVFKNGKLIRDDSISDIRNRIHNNF